MLANFKGDIILSQSFCQSYPFSSTISAFSWSTLPDLVSSAEEHVCVHVCFGIAPQWQKWASERRRTRFLGQKFCFALLRSGGGLGPERQFSGLIAWIIQWNQHVKTPTPPPHTQLPSRHIPLALWIIWLDSDHFNGPIKQKDSSGKGGTKKHLNECTFLGWSDCKQTYSFRQLVLGSRCDWYASFQLH